jgi:hypothetical protein
MSYKKFNIILVMFVILLIGIEPIYALDIDSQAGTSGAKFLKIGLGARSIGLGGAFVSVADNLDSIYYNPAGLINITLPTISLSHTEWLTDISIQNISYLQPTEIGNFAGSILYLHMGDIVARDTSGEPIGIFSSYVIVGNIAYSKEIVERIKAGINFKMFYETIEQEKEIGFAFDIGGLYSNLLISNLNLGLCLQNIGPQVKFIKESAPLPLNLKSGISYSLFENSLLLSTEFNIPRDNKPYFNVGIEYNLKKRLSFRVGYTGRNDFDQGITAGLGINIVNWNIDYAYVPYGNLDSTHRITISTSFGE